MCAKRLCNGPSSRSLAVRGGVRVCLHIPGTLYNMTGNPSSSCQGNLLKTDFDIPLAVRLACLKDLCAEPVMPASAGPQNTLADREQSLEVKQDQMLS